MEAAAQAQAKKEVEMTIRAFFEAGKNKDLTTLMDFHAPGKVFSKFDENPPYSRQTSEEAYVYEQAAFANISDYEYKVEDLRVDLVGDAAVATFYLSFKGMFVNDYSFEGMTVGSRARATMVLARFGGTWRFVHEHFSTFPEPTRKEPQRG